MKKQQIDCAPSEDSDQPGRMPFCWFCRDATHFFSLSGHFRLQKDVPYFLHGYFFFLAIVGVNSALRHPTQVSDQCLNRHVSQQGLPHFDVRQHSGRQMLPGQLVLGDHAAELVGVRALQSVVIHFHEPRVSGYVIVRVYSFVEPGYVEVVRLLVALCNPSERQGSMLP